MRRTLRITRRASSRMAAAGDAVQCARRSSLTGDALADLLEDLAAEQKARTTYDNLLRLVEDPEVRRPDPTFLREREIVHYPALRRGTSDDSGRSRPQ